MNTLQQMLSRVPGTFAGSVNGSYDTETELAVERFQRLYNINTGRNDRFLGVYNRWTAIGLLAQQEARDEESFNRLARHGRRLYFGPFDPLNPPENQSAGNALNKRPLKRLLKRRLREFLPLVIYYPEKAWEVHLEGSFSLGMPEDAAALVEQEVVLEADVTTEITEYPTLGVARIDIRLETDDGRVLIVRGPAPGLAGLERAEVRGFVLDQYFVPDPNELAVPVN